MNYSVNSFLKKTFSPSVKKKFAKISSFPKKLVIEPVSYCNLHCPLCLAGTDTLPRPKTTMPLDKFKKIIDQAEGKVDVLRLHGYGEPFLHKDILEMISYAKQKGIGTVLISTNGTQFPNFAFAKKVARSGLDRIVFSVDGVDQKSHEKYRAGADFKKVINSIKLLVRAKKELHSSTPEIFYQIMVMKHNEDLRDKALQLAKSLGVDRFVERSVIIPHTVPNMFQPLAQEFLPLNPFFNFYRPTSKGYRYQKDFLNDCDQIYSIMIINADGSVYPCCQDSLKPTTPSHPYYVGNVFKDSLKTIWNGKKLRDFRMHVFTNQKSLQPCAECPISRKLPSYGKTNYFTITNLNKKK